MLNAVQKHNGDAVILAVLRWADSRQADQHDLAERRVRHRLARMAVTCSLDEAELLIYANANIPVSLALPHDAVGTDHGSVGALQQQVGADGSNAFGWGTCQQCMNLDHAVGAFLDRAQALGLTHWDGPELWHRIQSVQVSFDPTGANYEAQMGRSGRFLLLHFGKVYRAHEANKRRAYRQAHQGHPKGTNRR